MDMTGRAGRGTTPAGLITPAHLLGRADPVTPTDPAGRAGLPEGADLAGLAGLPELVGRADLWDQAELPEGVGRADLVDQAELPGHPVGPAAGPAADPAASAADPAAADPAADPAAADPAASVVAASAVEAAASVVAASVVVASVEAASVEAAAASVVEVAASVAAVVVEVAAEAAAADSTLLAAAAPSSAVLRGSRPSSADFSTQPAGERPDPFDEPVEEHGRIDINADVRIGFSAPAPRPVGYRHAAGQGSRQLDVHRRRLGGYQLRVERDRGGQRIVQMRHISMAEAVIGLHIEPHRVVDQPNQRIGRVRPRGGRQSREVLRCHCDPARQIQPA
jgi:hypothetical protein